MPPFNQNAIMFVVLVGFAAVVALNAWYYHSLRNGTWHRWSTLRFVTLIDGRRVFGFSGVMRRIMPDGTKQYRAITNQENRDYDLDSAV